MVHWKPIANLSLVCVHLSALAALDRSSLQHGMRFQDLLASVQLPLLGMCFPSPSTWRTPQLRLCSIACVSGNPVPSSLVTAVLGACICACASARLWALREQGLCLVLFCTVAPNLAHNSLLNKHLIFDSLAAWFQEFIVVINVI